MLNKGILYLILTLFFVPAAIAQKYHYSYNANCHAAYQAYMSLHLPEGNAAILKEIKADPYNLMAVYLADYGDCLLLLFNGDAKALQQLRNHQDERLALLERGDKQSPWHKLCRAGIYMHWALVHVRFGENIKAGLAFRRSYLLLKENRNMFPQFEYNDIFFSMEQVVVGSIPDNYQWLASSFGMKGNINKGIATLAQFVNKHNYQSPLYNEAVIYYCYLKFYMQSKKEEVWAYIDSGKFETEDNLLNAFVKINIAVNYRKADEALRLLERAQTDNAYSRFPIMDYEMGTAYYLKLSPEAIPYFQKFATKFTGKMFVKDAWQKMALSYYLKGDMKQAQTCRAKITGVGSQQTDADKQAQRFAEIQEWPNAVLLQVRLLIDGGYYNTALKKISTVNEHTFSSISDKLEYSFRLARIYDELGDEHKALTYYKYTIAKGAGRKEQFAARSALQMGFTYERMNMRQEALAAYKQCLSMKNHDFQNSIDQQAKSGINRLTGG